jgi:multidrug efflux pump
LSVFPHFYSRLVGALVRHTISAVIAYMVLIALTVLPSSAFRALHSVQDMGYFLVVVQLPDGASFARTDEVVRRIDAIARNEPGVAHTFAISGYSSVLQANQSNIGAAFIIPQDFEKRQNNR